MGGRIIAPDTAAYLIRRLLPLLAIFSIVLAVAVLADALRGSMDPHGTR